MRKLNFWSARRQLRHVPLQSEGCSTCCQAEVCNLDDVVAEAHEQVRQAQVAVADVVSVHVAQAFENMFAVAPNLAQLQTPPGRPPHRPQALIMVAECEIQTPVDDEGIQNRQHVWVLRQ